MRLIRRFAPLALVLAMLVPGLGIQAAGAAHAAPMPSITLAPNGVVTGTSNSITVRGQGFPADSPITLQVDNATVIGSATTDGSGAFTATATIPDSPVGQHSVSATAAGGVSASQTLYVVNLSLSTSSAPAGSQVTLSGQGFLPSQPLIVRLGGQRVLATSSDASGSFTNQTFTVPALSPGQYRLRVRSGTSPAIVVIGAFTITAAQPTLVLTPSSVAAGGVFTVSGTGYPASAAISIKLGAVTLGTVTTSSAGALGPAQFTVPQGTPPGSQMVTANNSAGTILAQAALNVAAPATLSVSPNSGVAGAPVTVSGAGFQAGETVVISINNNTVTSTTANSQGQISLTFTLPQNLVPGAVTVLATGQVSHATATAIYTVPVASLTLSSSNGVPGSAVTAFGHNFAANELVTLTVGGTPVATATADGNGNFSSTIAIPAGQPAGIVTIAAAGQSSGQTASALLIVSGVPATLSVSPTSGIAGVPVTVTGGGFQAGETVLISINNSMVASTTANGQGQIGASFTLPQNLPAGAATLVATGQASHAMATTTYTVPAASLSLSITSGVPGVSVGVTGHDFAANEAISITLNGAQLATATADGNGNFSSTITIPAGQAPGSMTISARGQSSQQTASATLTVLARTASLSVTPGSITPGAQVKITGSGFAPLERVHLSVNGGAPFAAALTGADGSFVLTTTLPATVAPGTLQITASGASSGASASASLQLVVPTPAVSAAAVSTTWYLAGGRTGNGFSTRIAVLNPNARPVHGTITFFYGAGQTKQTSFTLAPKARGTYYAGQIIGTAARLATTVQANLPIVVARTTERGQADVMGSQGVPAPSRTWYLAEGYTGLTFLEDLNLFNPGSQVAHVHIVWPLFNGRPPVTDAVTLAPRSRTTIPVNAYVFKASHATVVTADQPVVVARSMRFGTLHQGATAKPGVTSAHRTLYFAEGSTANGFQEYLTILNPDNRRAAQVTATFFGRQGQLLGRRVIVVGPLHRGNIDVNEVARNAAIATVLHSTLPIVAERAMYFGPPNGVGSGGTDVLGQPSPALGWAFARGDTRPGHSEFELLFNPHPTSSTVLASYYTPRGQVVRKTFTLRGDARLNIDVTRMVPELARGLHSVVLRSLNGVSFVAEQALYTHLMAHGSAATGTPLS